MSLMFTEPLYKADAIVPKLSPRRTVRLHFSLGRTGMIAEGGYDSYHPFIKDAKKKTTFFHWNFNRKKSFPVELGEDRFEGVHMLSFNRRIWGTELRDYLERYSLEHATFAHLLGFGAWYKDDQLHYPIVALGSTDEVMPGHLVYVPCLCAGKRYTRGGIIKTRMLDIRHLRPQWETGYRFLLTPTIQKKLLIVPFEPRMRPALPHPWRLPRAA